MQEHPVVLVVNVFEELIVHVVLVVRPCGIQPFYSFADDHKRWLQVIRRMEDRITEVDGYDCIICFENRRNVIFNCKHLIACAQCAAKLNDCPMCRRRIMSKQTVQLYSWARTEVAVSNRRHSRTSLVGIVICFPGLRFESYSSSTFSVLFRWSNEAVHLQVDGSLIVVTQSKGILHFFCCCFDYRPIVRTRLSDWACWPES